MSLDFGTDNANRNRTFQPAKRVLIQDIDEGVWDDLSNGLQTRYGILQRIFLVGTITDKKEIVQENADESFIADDSKSKSRVNLTIDDGTGCISGTIWGNPNDYINIQKGVLVFCGGSLRNYMNRFYLTINIIRIIQNPNEECYHILKILYKRQSTPRQEIQKTENSSFGEINEKDTIPSEIKKDFKSNEESEQQLSHNQEDHQSIVQELENTSAIDNQEENIQKIEELPLEQVPKKKKGKKSDSNAETISERNAINEIDLELAIIGFIESHDSGDGTPSKEIAKEFKLDEIKLKQILDQLTQRIKIYKVKPGFYAAYKDN